MHCHAKKKKDPKTNDPKSNPYQSLNLRRPAFASPFAQPREYKRMLPSELFESSTKASEPQL